MFTSSEWMFVCIADVKYTLSYFTTMMCSNSHPVSCRLCNKKEVLMFIPRDSQHVYKNHSCNLSCGEYA